MPSDLIQFANSAPRCLSVRFNGQPCGQPARRGREFCRFHEPENRIDYSLPFVEDAASLQFAVMQVIRALHDKAIDSKTASLTLYGLQIAAMNLRRFDAERDHQAQADAYELEGSLAKILLDAIGKENPQGLEQLLAADRMEKSSASQE